MVIRRLSRVAAALADGRCIRNSKRRTEPNCTVSALQNVSNPSICAGCMCGLIDVGKKIAIRWQPLLLTLGKIARLISYLPPWVALGGSGRSLRIAQDSQHAIRGRVILCLMGLISPANMMNGRKSLPKFKGDGFARFGHRR